MEIRLPSPSLIVNKPILRIGVLQPAFALLLCIFDTWLGIVFALMFAIIAIPFSIRMATQAVFTLTDMRVNLWMTRVSLWGSLGFTFAGFPVLILLAQGEGMPTPAERHTALLGAAAFLISVALVITYVRKIVLPRQEPMLALIAADMVAPSDRGWKEAELDIAAGGPQESGRLMWVAYLVLGMLPVVAVWLNRDVRDVRMGALLILAPALVVMLLSMIPKELRTDRVLSLLSGHERKSGRTFQYAELDRINAVRAKTWLGRRFGPPVEEPTKPRTSRRRQEKSRPVSDVEST
jgi:hypothetical protein